jgi:hypothetical protein
MTNDEIVGRLAVLEVLSMTALGLYLANARNDPDHEKATALLDHTRTAVANLAAALPPETQAAARQYADQLLSNLAQNIRVLRGEGGPSNH